MKFYQVQYKIDSGFYFVADDNEVISNDHPDVQLAIIDDVKGQNPVTDFAQLVVTEWKPEFNDKGQIVNLQFDWNEYIIPYSTEKLSSLANRPLNKLCKTGEADLHGKTIVINGKTYQLNQI